MSICQFTGEEEIAINKKTDYLNLINAVENLLDSEHHELSILANSAALIKMFMRNVNWAGFYLLKGDLLILGPFQGKPACNPIRTGTGVCGKCVEARKTIVVPNVHEFEGHIPCDEATNSEIVIPIFIDDEIYGVLDLDSKQFNRFFHGRPALSGTNNGHHRTRNQKSEGSKSGRESCIMKKKSRSSFFIGCRIRRSGSL